MDIEQYGRKRQIELGQSLSGKKKIFLDTRFWILLRSVEQGVESDPDLRKLLFFIRKGVREGRWICPISASLFLELMKQPFTATRRPATARLIDELSLGVCSIPPQQLTGTEIVRFMLGLTGNQHLHEMQELIWTKASYVLGMTYPVFSELTAEDAFAVQKIFFDELWDCSLGRMVEVLGDTERPHDPFEPLSAETNAKNRLHRDKLQSFEATYDIELRGAIDAAGELAADALEHCLLRLSPDALNSGSRVARLNAGKNILYEGMRGPKGRHAVRTLHVAASLHAAMRWDKERKFKANDYFDFEHATVAVGYCDAFLTEGPLHALVTDGNVRLQEVNGCAVASRIEDALDLVRRLQKDEF